MNEQSLNDNGLAQSERLLIGREAHGQAALLLVESLLHGLLARSVITVTDAVEIVEIAAEAQDDIADGLNDSTAIQRKSLLLLDSIRRSLAHDLPK